MNDRNTKDAQGVPARRAALRLLDAVLRRGEPMDGASHGATLGLSGPDRALAIAIASECCRHLVGIDALIDGATRERLADDLKARMVLRIAITQALVLGTPPHAAISTVLPLVSGGPKRLVHGVFGTLFRAQARLPDPPLLPPEVAARWQAAWGDAVTAAAARALGHAPPLDLSIKDPASTAHWAEALGGTSMIAGHVRLPRGGDVAKLAGYGDGAWWVQDLAAAIPARLLGAGDGANVLDIGAAPGGKTMQLAAAGWVVTALDSSAKRLERMQVNLKRTGLSAETLTGDARALPAGRTWDAILIDAPCSATGIFRRHPDVLHRVGDAAIADRAALQAAMIDAASAAVRPGGRMVYAVCSMEPAEGEEQVAAFLSRGSGAGWRIDPVRGDELPGGIAPSPDGTVRTLPGMVEDAGGLDGFFMARLVRG